MVKWNLGKKTENFIGPASISPVVYALRRRCRFLSPLYLSLSSFPPPFLLAMPVATCLV